MVWTIPAPVVQIHIAIPATGASGRVERLQRSANSLKRGRWNSNHHARGGELTVINLIAQGATNRDVAAQLHLSLHTVKNHVHNAFAKLGVSSRVELSQLVRGADDRAN